MDEWNIFQKSPEPYFLLDKAEDWGILRAMEMIEDRVDEIDKRIELLLRSQEEFKEAQKRTNEEIERLRAAQEKTDEQLRKTEKEIDKMAREIGGGLGRIAEGLTAPSVPKLFKRLGMRIDEVQQRVRVYQDGRMKTEIDLICPGLFNGKEIVLVGEIKAHLTIDDIKDFIDDDLKNFKDYLPRYREAEVYGLVAGLYLGGDVARFAERQGLYILTPSGDTMRILNSIDFKPKAW